MSQTPQAIARNRNLWCFLYHVAHHIAKMIVIVRIDPFGKEGLIRRDIVVKQRLVILEEVGESVKVVLNVHDSLMCFAVHIGRHYFSIIWTSEKIF